MSWDTETTNQSAAGDRSIPSAENHSAVMVGLIDLGSHDEDFNGKQSVMRKCLFLWEIVDEKRPDGSPFVMDMELSWMPKLGLKSKLRKTLEAWRGKPYAEGEKPNIPGLMGKPCLLNVGHKTSAKGNPYAVLLGVAPPLRGQQVPAPTLGPYTWHFDSGETADVPDWVPFMAIQGCTVADYIAQSYEGRGLPVPAANHAPAPRQLATVGTAAAEDDIPF